MPAQPRKALPKKALVPKQAVTKPPVDAAVEEATDTRPDLTLAFRGDDYVIDAGAEDTLDFRDAMQRGGDTDIVHALLGPGQYRMLLARHGRDDGEQVIQEFVAAYGAARGQGNS